MAALADRRGCARSCAATCIGRERQRLARLPAQRQRVCHGVVLPLAVNVPPLIEYSLVSMFLLDVARMRPSRPLISENSRVCEIETKLTTISIESSAFVRADKTVLESLASPNSRS